MGRENKNAAHIPSTLPLWRPASQSPVCFCLQCRPTRPALDVVTQQIFTANLESVPEHAVHHSRWRPAELAPACVTKKLSATADSASPNPQLN